MDLFKFLILLNFVVLTAAHAVRVVTLNPQSTELMVQMGKTRDLVAGSSYPLPSSPSLDQVGPLFMPSIERLVRFAPDWVLSDSFFTSPTFLEGLSALGIHQLTVQISDLDSLLSESRRILSSFYGETENKEFVIANQCLETLPKKTAGFTYLAFAWLDPPILFGEKAYLTDLFRRMGGVAPSLPRITSPYPQVSEEWLLTKKVDVIYYLVEGNEPRREAVEKFVRHWWPEVQPKIVALPSEKFSRPTFTPLKYWSELHPTGSYKTSEACEKL